MYFKITNLGENHHGFQYKDGLNVLDKKFDSEGSCVIGGLYFAEAEYIFNFLNHGIWLREISLPVEDPDFLMTKDPSGTKWRANKIILGEQYSLSEPETFELLIGKGAVINFSIEKHWLFVYNWAMRNNCPKILKYLANKQPKILEKFDDDLIASVTNRIHAQVETLVKNDPHAVRNYVNPIRIALSNNSARMACIIKLLFKNTEIFKDLASDVLKYAAEISFYKLAKLAIKKGGDFSLEDNYVFDLAVKNGFYPLVDLLVKKGIDFKANNNYAINLAARKCRLNIVEFFLHSGANISDITNDSIKKAKNRNYYDPHSPMSSPITLKEFLEEKALGYTDVTFYSMGDWWDSLPYYY